MKKTFGLALVMIVVFVGTLVVCDPTGGSSKEWDNGKTVAEEYRGIYVSSGKQTAWEFTTNKVILWNNYKDPQLEKKEYTWPAWTEEGDDGDIEVWVRGTKSYFDHNAENGISEFKFGKFADNKFTDTVRTSPQTYTKEEVEED
jgi:hypothetical protein